MVGDLVTCCYYGRHLVQDVSEIFISMLQIQRGLKLPLYNVADCLFSQHIHELRHGCAMLPQTWESPVFGVGVSATSSWNHKKKKKKGFEQQLRELKSRLNRREAPATFSTEHEFFLIVPHVPMSERWRDLHCITLRQ